MSIQCVYLMLCGLSTWTYSPRWDEYVISNKTLQRTVTLVASSITKVGASWPLKSLNIQIIPSPKSHRQISNRLFYIILRNIKHLFLLISTS